MNETFGQFKATCMRGHPLQLVSEGYAICSRPAESLIYPSNYWFAWKLSPPYKIDNLYDWALSSIIGRDQNNIPAWCSTMFDTKTEALEHIAQDIAIHRTLPYNEE